MIDSLELIKAFIEVALAGACGPEHVPLVTLSVRERVCLQDASHQLCVAFKQFVKHLTVIDMIAAPRALRLKRSIQQLLLRDWLYMDQLIECVYWCGVQIA